jgi:hypothetical protein
VSSEREAIAQYWRTAICDVKPGSIAFRGYPIQSLIGRLSFPGMIWLLLRGELASDDQAALLEAAMVASVDHGPHAPGIAIARMAVTTGLPLNGAIASAVNTLDDVHGGAGEQAIELRKFGSHRLGNLPGKPHSLRHDHTRRITLTSFGLIRSGAVHPLRSYSPMHLSAKVLISAVRPVMLPSKYGSTRTCSLLPA